MSARPVALVPLTTVAVLAATAPVALGAVGQARVDGSLRIDGDTGNLARAVWHDRGDVLCAHASRQEAVASFRLPSGRVVTVTDVKGGAFWTCSDNLDLPEDNAARLVLGWKRVGFQQYARTASTRIHT